MPKYNFGAVFNFFSCFRFKGVFEHLDFTTYSTLQGLFFLFASINKLLPCIVIEQLVMHVEVDPGQNLEQGLAVEVYILEIIISLVVQVGICESILYYRIPFGDDESLSCLLL